MKIIAANGFEVRLKRQNGIGLTLVQQISNTFYLFLKYSFLLFLLFLLASHETANPKLGSTNIEFYSVAFRNAILDQNVNGNRLVQNTDTSVQLLYAERNYTPLWTVNFDIKLSYRELEELIAHAYSYGLLPSFYHYNKLTELELMMASVENEKDKLDYRIEFEKTASEALLLLSKHMATGIGKIDTSTSYLAFIEHLPAYLNEQINMETLREGILNLQPDNRPYRRLQSALAKYMSAAGSDTLIYSLNEISSNRDLQVSRLILQGFLDQSFAGDSLAFHSALRNFQRLNGIEITGQLNKQTLKILSENTKEKFYKIAINLDRIRKDELKNNNYILVNIPEFQLQYYDNLGRCTEFNVIVGKEVTPTPILTSQIEMIVANPHWTVPQSISRNELIPMIKKDSLYLQKHGFTVVDNKSNPVDITNLSWTDINPEEFNYWFRQTKRDNALGLVKFLFPNEHAVYLHDTQAKSLFSKRKRAYSHGCIRLQDPVEFAKILVSGYTNDDDKIDIENIIRNEDLKQVRLDKPLPIYIRYYSCSADSLGNIYFHPDIYSLDEPVIEHLFANTTWN